jgi:signal peptidase I
MLLSRAIAAVISIFAPGAGHPIVGRFWRGAAWCLLYLGMAAAVVFWPPLLLATFAVRLGAAVDVLFAGRGRGMPRPGDWIGAGVLLATALAAVFSLSSSIELMRIPTGSMEPTLSIGDHVVVRTFRYTPARGDVVVMRQPAQGPLARTAGRVLAKRIVALGGQTVAVQGQVVHVDGAALPLRSIGAASYWEEQAGDHLAREESFAFEEAIGDRRYRVLGVAPDGAAGERSLGDFPSSRMGCAALAMEAVAGSAPPACKVPAGSVFVLGDNRSSTTDSRIFGAVDRKEIIGRVIGSWWADGPDGIGWDRVGRIR